MDWATFAVQWLHVLTGIVWFGGTLAVNFMLIPGIVKLPFDEQREASTVLGRSFSRVLVPVSAVVVVLGFLRGTVFGPVKSVDYALTTPYGLVWLASLILGIGLFFWGSVVVNGGAKKLVADDAPWTGDGPNAAYMAHIAGLRRDGLIELVGFFVLFTLMILMRFGVPL